MAARRTYTCRAKTTREARDWVRVCGRGRRGQCERDSGGHLWPAACSSALFSAAAPPSPLPHPTATLLPTQATALREQRASSKGRRYRNRQLVELLVSKENGSLGITIGGGVDSGHADKTQIFVTQIKAGGAAERQVRGRPGRAHVEREEEHRLASRVAEPPPASNPLCFIGAPSKRRHPRQH